MCNLCSINHFTDDEYDNEYNECELSLCVNTQYLYEVNHANTQRDWLKQQIETVFVSTGSSF